MREELKKFFDVPLSSERRAELSKILVTALSSIDQKQRELGSTSGRIRAEIKELETKLKNTYEILIAGVENSEVACFVERDYRLGEVRIIRTDNLDCVEKRPMSAKERQDQFEFDKKGTESPAGQGENQPEATPGVEGAEATPESPPPPLEKFEALYFPDVNPALSTVSFYDANGNALFKMDWETKQASAPIRKELPENFQAVIEAYMKNRDNPSDAEFTLGGLVPEPVEELPEPPHDETVDPDQLKSFDIPEDNGVVQTVPDDELPEDDNPFYSGEKPAPAQEEKSSDEAEALDS